MISPPPLMIESLLDPFAMMPGTPRMPLSAQRALVLAMRESPMLRQPPSLLTWQDTPPPILWAEDKASQPALLMPMGAAL